MDPKNLRAFFEKKASEGHGEFAIAYALLRLADVQAVNNRTPKEAKSPPAMKSTDSF